MTTIVVVVAVVVNEETANRLQFACVRRFINI